MQSLLLVAAGGAVGALAFTQTCTSAAAWALGAIAARRLRRVRGGA